ncbi:probable flavin-containing monooxygenase 1 [Rutidosis leptorrhynchoides]|uniref:probable flavin-containing monooxygenase 1 n=1 Tax=Rutidosis leptorrhynchoides TaxID=125765 RepID=UPI003A995470
MVAIFSKIGIIGGGVSGLVAAKQLSKHNPILFEATESIGGVWHHCSYRTTRLQTPSSGYQFSDFPWPQSDDTNFPTYIEILNYINSYANHFGLFKFINFNSKVTGVRFVGDQENSMSGKPMWEVSVHNTKSDTIQLYAFEFLMVCSGKYGDVPLIPKFPTIKDQKVFKGTVMHSQDYSKLNVEESIRLLKGKKVVVVGYKKSAIDLVLESVEANQGKDGKACTMLVRTPHWTLPHYSIWGLPFYLFFSSKFSQFFRQRPNQGFVRDLLCKLFSPMRNAASKIIESYLLWKLPLVKYGLKPDHPFEEDYASCQLAILPEEFFHETDKGNIIIKRASKWWFWEGGVELDDNTKLDADVILLATGYDAKKKLNDILPEPFQSFLNSPSGMMSLYRGTIHPLIPNMAFIGYMESAANIYIAEITCKWFSRMIDDKFKLPSTDQMLEQITKEMEIMKSSSRFYKRGCLSTFINSYIDETFKEMRCSDYETEI